MDKRKERKAFDAVYGLYGLTVVECEAPDFVCLKPGMDDFGVEVREFFLTENDARMQKIANYVKELVVDGKYCHKDDRREIEVRDITYHVASTGQKIHLKAIPRMIPPHWESMPKLLAAVAEKNDKFALYERRVKP